MAPPMQPPPPMAPPALPPLSAIQPAVSPIQPLAPPPMQPLPPLGTPSVLGASNQAASVAPPPPAEAAASVVAAAEAKGRAAPATLVDLVWFDPDAPDRARLHAPWQDLIFKLVPPPAEGEPDADPAEDPPAIKDRRDVLGVLAGGEPAGLDDLEGLVDQATSKEGGLTPPLVLVAGELELGFDEQRRLAAGLAAVGPLTAGPDKKLKDTFDAVSEGAKAPWAQGSARAAEALLGRLAEAVPPGPGREAGWLDQQIERAVVEERAYRKRKVLGKTMLRAVVGQRGSTTQVPVYLPEDVGGALPLYARFSARMVAEVHLQQDQYEACPYALRVLALGRVVIPARAAGRAAARPRG
jgi:hypothetical protein